MIKEEKEFFLKQRQWFQYYNKNYWCNEKCIQDKARQDFTYYGMSLEEAYEFEINNKSPFPPIGVIGR